MKKQTLLGAAALSTLAIAGAANAQSTLTGAAVAGAPVGTVTAPTKIASEATLTATTSKGTIGLALTPSATAILPSGNALLKVSLTGGATFGSTVTAGAVVANGGCAPTTVVSSGGAATDSTVTFLVSSLGGCTNAVPINLLVPVRLATGSTSNVDVVTNLTTEAGTPIDGGTASTFVPAAGNNPSSSLISFAKAFNVTITPDTAGSTKVALANKFTTLSGDNTIGKATLAINAYRLGLNSTATTSAADLSSANFTVKGDLTNLKVSVDGVQATTANAGVVAVANPTAKDYVVTVATTGAATPPTIPGGAYTLAVQLVPTTASGLAGSTFGPSALETITREGSSYLIPWVASGTLAQASTSNTVIRVSNISTTATGAVSAELLNSSGGVAASTALVPLATSIGSRGELVITSATLEAAFGANFGRGDVRITVEGEAGNLVVRRFVQSTTTGALSEVSLGRSATSGGQEPVN